MINWALISHPANWIIVFLMVSFAAILVSVLAGGTVAATSHSGGNSQ